MLFRFLGAANRDHVDDDSLLLVSIAAAFFTFCCLAIVMLIHFNSTLPSWTLWPSIAAMITFGTTGVFEVGCYWIMRSRTHHAKKRGMRNAPKVLMLEGTSFVLLLLEFFSMAYIYLLMCASASGSSFELLLTKNADFGSSSSVIILVIAMIVQPGATIWLDHLIDTHLREIPTDNGSSAQHHSNYGGGGGGGGGGFNDDYNDFGDGGSGGFNDKW